MSDRMEKYEAVLTTFEYDVKALERNSSLYPEHVAATNEKLKNFRNRLEEVTIESESINDLQLCLVKGSNPTDYSTRLETLDTDLEPFEKLWGNVAKFLNLMKVWRESPLASISPGTVESELDGLRRIMQKMQRTFRASFSADPLKVVDSLIEQHQAFIEKEWPLIEIVCTPGMRQRHWDDISKITGISVFAKPETNIADMVKINMHQHTSSIEEICVNAAKEYSIEKALDTMLGEWEGVVFERPALRLK